MALTWPARRLGCITLRDGDMARRAAYLFCFNPASIFYSAVYSESLFAFLTFSGALSLALGNPYRAAVAFFASSATRSNGTPLALRFILFVTAYADTACHSVPQA